MKDLLKNIGKSLLMFGIAAAAWTALTPALATIMAPVLGLSVTTSALAAVEATAGLTKALWVGASFGMFGGLYAAVQGVSNIVFPEKKLSPSERSFSEIVNAKAISMPEPECNIEEPAPQFRKRLEEERFAAASIPVINSSQLG
jgi:hypothetical protein